MSDLSLSLSNNARGFLEDLQPKQYKQVGSRIIGLQRNPYPADCKHLSGHPGFRRIDVGEFRVCYTVSDDTIRIVVAARRNDDAAYRELDRARG